MCPADPVLSAESGSASGQPSHGQGPEAYLTPLLQALSAQTAAINRLAASNEALVQAMCESEGMDDLPSSTYLDGSPVR